MRSIRLRRHPRAGSVLVLAALLLIPLTAMVAFAVDIGWIALTKAELQDAADAAALAGADQLMNGFVQFNSPGQTNKDQILSQSKQLAISAAQQYASYNGTRGVSSLKLDSGDVEFGFTGATGNYTPLASNGIFPNTIKVTLRRDATANGSLNLFFAPVLGQSSANVQVVAAATLYSGRMTSMNGYLPNNGTLLPLALDINFWNQFLATGQSQDGTINLGSNGAPQLPVYPNPGDASGCFGLLHIGPPANATGTFSDWIDAGPSSGDIQYLSNRGMLPASLSDPAEWQAGTGMRGALAGDFSDAIGSPRLIPVFQPSSFSPYQATFGHGSNATFQIVGFVGVEISSTNGIDVCVQPCAVIDPSSMFDPTSIQPAGTTQPLVTTFVAPKLTQ